VGMQNTPVSMPAFRCPGAVRPSYRASFKAPRFQGSRLAYKPDTAHAVCPCGKSVDVAT
jgi:hypothetical protein